MRITINSGTTFLISDQLGAVTEATELGLYHEDVRFLSRYELTLDGKPLIPLAATTTDPHVAVLYATNPALKGVSQGTLTVMRRRTLNEGLHEDIEITNYGDGRATCDLQLALDADFAHLFEVRRMLASGHPRRTPKPVRSRVDLNTMCMEAPNPHGGARRQLWLRFTPGPSHECIEHLRFALDLASHERWRLAIDVTPQVHRAAILSPRHTPPPSHALLPDAEVANRWPPQIAFPVLETDNALLRRVYAQSVRDFMALRISGGVSARAGEYAIGAGIPWFMTLFGRDSLLAAYQALPFAPNAARGTLRALARLQGTRRNRARGEAPGKILHEQRSGDFIGSRRPFFPFPYYGTVDATPLFLILLASLYDVTDDAAFVRELRGNALAALEWMERDGDRDGDGYIEYAQDSAAGLHNQGWKDSSDAIRFADGRLAAQPVALCEAQGYAYAAYVGMAGVFAALGEPQTAMRLRTRAATLKANFNRDYWMPARGCYALALDADKRQVDAITSNPGHLLWAGIADDDKAREVADTLLSPAMFSGWGIRTMASTEGGYNPLSYHCGSVWPHDNSLIVAGLLRYGHVEAARRVTEGLLRALEHFPDHRLPELFAGIGMDEAPMPVEYFEANRPQAWATGAIFLLLAAMTGVAPMAGGAAGQPRTSAAPLFLPEGIDIVTLDGVWRRGAQGRVTTRRGADAAVEAESDSSAADDDAGVA